MSVIHDEHRQAWRETRLRLEARLDSAARRSAVDGERRCDQWMAPLVELAATGSARLVGLYGRGAANARALRHAPVAFDFPHLPAAFDGYRILHMSDLHLGTVPGLIEALVPVLHGLPADLVVFTGDFQTRGWPEAPQAASLLRPVVEACRAPDGLLAVLGNHDSVAMADALEGLGVRMLLNESLTLRRGEAAIHLTGTDDVHAFHTPAAEAALAARRDGFRIALQHSVEMAHVVEHLGYALHLSGHTHGGQICLPGGKPVMTALDRHRALAKGAWRLGDLQGYTSSGTGSSPPPLRFHSRPEVAVVTLRRGQIP